MTWISCLSKIIYAGVEFAWISRKFAESESSCHRLNHTDAKDTMKPAVATRKNVRDRESLIGWESILKYLTKVKEKTAQNLTEQWHGKEITKASIGGVKGSETQNYKVWGDVSRKEDWIWENKKTT